MLDNVRESIINLLYTVDDIRKIQKGKCCERS